MEALFICLGKNLNVKGVAGGIKSAGDRLYDRIFEQLYTCLGIMDIEAEEYL